MVSFREKWLTLCVLMFCDAVSVLWSF